MSTEPWSSRPARRVARLVVGALLIATLVGCSTAARSTDVRESRRSPAAPRVGAVKRGVTCDDVMKGKPYCSTIHVGDLDVRYAYVPARAHQQSLILVDRGGPGASLFGPTWPADLITQVRRVHPHAAMLMLEEPWVTSRPTSRCSHASSAWYQALRLGRVRHSPAKSVVEACGLNERTSTWGWDPVDYGRAVRAIEDRLGTKATAFTGASFAGVRLSYLRRSWHKVSLVSPLPAATPLRRYLAVRQSGLNRLIARCPLCATGDSTRVPGRSVPVTGFDRTAALVAMEYRSPSSQKGGVRRVVQATAVHDLTWIGSLSDSTLGRIGATQVSPAVLAIWSEQCKAMPGSRGPTPGGFFADLYSPCQFIDSVPAIKRRVEARKLCLAITRSDQVVPPALSRHGFRTESALELRTVATAHGSLHGLEQCW